MTDEELKRLFEAHSADNRGYAELDRRMSSLEQSQSRMEDAIEDLQSRVERLEGSTN